MERKDAWIVRKVDVFAAFAWMVFIVLATTEDVTHRREPWLIGVAGAACVLSLIAYATRKFEKLETEAFERGMDAARDGLLDIRDHTSL